MRFVQHFENKTRRTKHESSQERADRPLSIHAGPENPKNKANGNRRTDIRLHALQIDVQFSAEEVNEGNPQQAQQNHAASGNSSEGNQLAFRGLRAYLLVEIQGYQR